MSLEAMLWVKKHAPVENTTEMCLLYALADRAHPDGTAAWPSYATLADETRTSRRTVIRHMQALERRGLIERGDQSLLDQKGYPRDRRPVVWDLNLALQRGTAPVAEEAETTGCQNDTPPERGATRGTTGCQPVHDGVPPVAQRGATVGTQTPHNPPLTQQNPPSTSGSGEPDTCDGDLFAAADAPQQQAPKPAPKLQRHTYTPEFEKFWKAYPTARGASKFETSERFAKALQYDTAENIIAGAERFADDPTRNPQYTPMPTTWLNKKRWTAEPDEVQQQVLQQPVQAPNPWAAYLDDEPTRTQEPRPDYAQGHTIIDDWS